MNIRTIMLKHRFVVLIIFFVGIQEIRAQDHPIPIDISVIGYNNARRDYYEKLNQIFMTNLSHPEFQILVCPSFSPNYLIYMEDVDNIVKKTANENISENSKLDQITTSEKKVSLPRGLGHQLKNLFQEVIIETKYSDEITMGLDGITYYMITEREKFGYGGEISGKIWSPQEGTKMKDLEHIIQLLDRMVDSQNPTLAEEISQRAEQLAARLDPVQFEAVERGRGQQLDSIKEFLDIGHMEELQIMDNKELLFVLVRAMRNKVPSEKMQAKLNAYFAKEISLEMLGTFLWTEEYIEKSEKQRKN